MRSKNSETSFLRYSPLYSTLPTCHHVDLHGGVAAGGVEDVVPLLLGQLTVAVFIGLVEHLLDLRNGKDLK